MAFSHLLFSLLISGTMVSGQAYSDSSAYVSMAVLSDPHYYKPGLDKSMESSTSKLNSHGKLIGLSDALLTVAIENILSSEVQMVLIPGDLTKDGALRSHQGMAIHLSRLKNRGIKVFVVPGNHDVYNKRSMSFAGDSSWSVPNVSPEKFASLYGPYGYDSALFRDPGSLSYVAEPKEGTWIIGLDVCVYEGNDSMSHSETWGVISKEQQMWLESILKTEEAAQKTKVVLMHHGILEHFKTQKRHFREYVLEDHRKLSRWLAGLGIQTVFTGHFHANDITLHRWKDGSFLFDIETGSLVTYPCPIRKISIRGDSMDIRTEYIQVIPSMENGLQELARNLVSDGASKTAKNEMIKWKLNTEDADYLSKQLGNLFSEHCLGDEPNRNPVISTEGVSFWGRLMILFRRGLIQGLAHDLPPADKELSIHLNTGEYD